MALPGWPTRSATGRVLAGARGRNGQPRSLRIFADRLSETVQVTDAGWLTCAGAAGEPKLAPLRRASVGLPPFGHVLARPGLPMRSTRTSALRDLVQAICPRRTEEITIFPVSGSFAAKAEPIRSYLAPGRSFGRSGPSPWRLIRIGDLASVGRDLPWERSESSKRGTACH